MGDASSVEPEESKPLLPIKGETGFVDRRGKSYAFTPLIQNRQGSQKPHINRSAPLVIAGERTGKRIK